MSVVEVVAGVIFNDDHTEVLLSLRTPEQHQGDRWEFPGGKLEADETQKAGLVRELQEELGIIVTSCSARALGVEHHYSDKCVRLHFWNVTAFDGQPIGREGQRVEWVPLNQLRERRFPAANQSIVESLLAQGEG